jgi:enoyl-CoA hydratase
VSDTGQPLLVERFDDGVVQLTLNVPERRNAMVEALTEAWGATTAQLADDRSVRAVVVTGAGSAFCAGGDLSWIGYGGEGGTTPDTARDKMYAFYKTWLSIRDLQVPVLAAINGPAMGAGLCLALACDLRYAAPTARFGAPFASLGMATGMGASYLLPEAVGALRAREMLYAGTIVQADRAVEFGLANEVVAEGEDVVAHTRKVASRVAGQAPIAVRLIKAALRHGPRSYAEALEWEALAQPVTMATADLQEGLRAQAERRRPSFSGR